VRALIVTALLLAAAAPAAAGNSAEEEQKRAEEEYLLKINLACGTQLTIKYDAASLAQHNQDIRYDQTGGGNQCNEPLRYVWYACQTPAGKARIQSAHLSRIVCRGTPGKVGSLSVHAGTITVERAYQEDTPFLRSRKQFEAALQLKLQIQTEDPYHDEAWSKLRQQENPVLSTSDYCTVDGKKQKLDLYVADAFIRRKQDAKIQCMRGGKIVTDLVIKQGVQTGFSTVYRDQIAMRRAYRDGKPHGEQRVSDGDRPKSLELYEDGREVSSSTYHPNGMLERYSRRHPDHIDSVSFDADGDLQSLSCSPQSRDDKTLRRWCGFEGSVTHSISDGTGKVARIVTYKDGVLQKQAAGTSEYGSGSNVAYRDGKKHGEERVVDKNGKLRELITWNRGVKDGKERHYSDDGKKVVEEIVWQAGQMKQRTELFLNGNPKLREVWESPTKKRTTEFWDTGKTRTEVSLLSCERRRYRAHDWCEEGVGKTYYEDGTLESETSWQKGERHGTHRAFWPNGKPQEVEEYKEGKLQKARRWDRDGQQTVDEEYEADGSRKLTR
jgi:antitoxin component YwqK of YwqJK toxin-antitoxin module